MKQKRRRNGHLYRKIYEKNNGPIPVDTEGRSFDIHHIDGDKNNNDPSNLIALSIEEHYNIHHKQEDWTSCLSIGRRMKIDPKVLSLMASRSNKERIDNRTHNFLDKEQQKNWAINRVVEGTHHFLGEKNPSVNRVKNNTHHFLGGSINQKMMAEGIHPLQKKMTCPVCNKTMSKPLYTRYKHGMNCETLT